MTIEGVNGIAADRPPVTTRGYQQELLQESLRRNIVIALDTGSGKTLIAILRMKHETERMPDKISWFLAPTVTLIKQQRDVIASFIPVPVGLVSGDSNPDQWKNASLWADVLSKNRIIVSTPQVLLDALSHGYVKLGVHISLLVFDEAHHAISKHPYNEIMKRFYHILPPNQPKDSLLARPAILGLSASPIYGGDENKMQKAFRDLEANLDSVVLSSRYNREELATYVHRPEFKYVSYPPNDDLDSIDCYTLVSLESVVDQMNIEDDPYVISLRSQLAKLPAGRERDRVDQRLSKTLHKSDTFSHKGMRDFARTAKDLCVELGSWAADWYITTVLQRAQTEARLHAGVMASWQNEEKRYLLSVIGKVQLYPISFDPDVIRAGISPKVRSLLQSLLTEEENFRRQDELYSGIVFVTRRDAVITLGEIITRLPEMSDKFRVGCLLGSSSSFKRHAFMDITRTLLKDDATQTLNDFRIGEKNLIVSTSVAEEGIDIQACGSVVRFDPPPNMVAWAQSRGRARRHKSTFIVLLDERELQSHHIHSWQDLERHMISFYNNPARIEEEPDEQFSENDLMYEVEETGALLTLQNAMSHLHHFCAVIPHTTHAPQLPIFELDPPDYMEGWHSLNPRPGNTPYEGPWGAICTLPRQVPAEIREIRTDRVYPTKRSAQNHAAFTAYYHLYLQGLVNDHLLPQSDFIKPDDDGAVELLLKEIEKRAGTANVPIQMDPWLAPSGPEAWWYNEVEIEGLPRLFMFTRRELPQLSADDLPVLHVPGQGSLTVNVVSLPEHIDDEDVITAAQKYTRSMFATLYDKRMDLSKLDFCYLFLPMDIIPTEGTWSQRRQWARERVGSGAASRLESESRANADAFGKQFGYPVDITLVRANDKWDKHLRFLGWNEGPISQEEVEELVDRFDIDIDEITFPLMLVEPFPRRANFLMPLEDETSGLSNMDHFLLLPQLTTIEMATPEDVQLAFLLPSVLRFLSFAATVQAMRNTLFADEPKLSSIPFPLLRTAMTAPVTQEPVHYERLETLGDCVLKYLVSIQLYSQYPLWHEGYLARRKDHAVSNQQLAKQAIDKDLQTWMIRDRFVPRKWRPKYSSDPVFISKFAQDAIEADGITEDAPQPEPVADNETPETAKDVDAVDAAGAKKSEGADKPEEAKPKPKKKKQRTQELSTKMLADVVESLLGAAYEHGGFDLATECARKFGLGIQRWDTVSMCVENALAKVVSLDNLPPELSLVEKMLGYSFTHPTLLVEALTHASYTGDLKTVSYERLEFIGDAVLDMIVTDFLYHAPGRLYKPGHMHIRKESLVNSHLLAFMCLRTYIDIDKGMPAWNARDGLVLTQDTQRIHLYRCMLHSSPRVLDDLEVTFTRWEKQADHIQRALLNDAVYPWAALTSLQAPKFVSDMLESILGAVFLDSHGSLDAVRGVLEKIDFTAVMDRVISDEVDVLHPMSRLRIWADKNKKECKVVMEKEKEKGYITCIVKVDGVEEFRATERSRGKTSYNQVRFAAAEGAIRKFEVKEQEEVEDVEEVGEELWEIPEGW